MNFSEEHFCEKVNKVSKAINTKDSCKRLEGFNVESDVTVSSKQESIVNQLCKIENHTNISFMSILNRIKYSIKDIVDFDCFKNEEVFTVLVDGKKKNGYLVDLKTALNFYNYFVIEKDHPIADVEIQTARTIF